MRDLGNVSVEARGAVAGGKKKEETGSMKIILILAKDN